MFSGRGTGTLKDVVSASSCVIRRNRHDFGEVLCIHFGNGGRSTLLDEYPSSGVFTRDTFPKETNGSGSSPRSQRKTFIVENFL